MPQKITKSVKTLMEQATNAVDSISVDNAKGLNNDDNYVFVDLRDEDERQRNGAIPGAVHSPRGMLEFYIDPNSPIHKDVFAQDKFFVFYCATGWRSAFAGKTAVEMGLKPVLNLEGGIAAWKEAGGDVETPQ